MSDQIKQAAVTLNDLMTRMKSLPSTGESKGSKTMTSSYIDHERKENYVKESGLDKLAGNSVDLMAEVEGNLKEEMKKPEETKKAETEPKPEGQEKKSMWQMIKEAAAQAMTFDPMTISARPKKDRIGGMDAADRMGRQISKARGLKQDNPYGDPIPDPFAAKPKINTEAQKWIPDLNSVIKNPNVKAPTNVISARKDLGKTSAWEMLKVAEQGGEWQPTSNYEKGPDVSEFSKEEIADFLREMKQYKGESPDTAINSPDWNMIAQTSADNIENARSFKGQTVGKGSAKFEPQTIKGFNPTINENMYSEADMFQPEENGMTMAPERSAAEDVASRVDPKMLAGLGLLPLLGMGGYLAAKKGPGMIPQGLPGAQPQGLLAGLIAKIKAKDPKTLAMLAGLTAAGGAGGYYALKDDDKEGV